VSSFEHLDLFFQGGKPMQIRRFSPDLKVKIPGNHPGLYGSMILLNHVQIPPEKQEEVARRFNGLPLALEAGLQVEAMYFDPHSSMEEHSADHSILFLVIRGYGTVRIGGPTGETRVVQAGEAVLWPAHVDHTVWTDEQELFAIVINAFTTHPI
jgi:quercetin dioxygenase-like cupin family protein